MLAKYNGHCKDCGKVIEVGQQITWNRRVRCSARHIDCSNPNLNKVEKPEVKRDDLPVESPKLEVSKNPQPKTEVPYPNDDKTIAAIASQLTPEQREQVRETYLKRSKIHAIKEVYDTINANGPACSLAEAKAYVDSIEQELRKGQEQEQGEQSSETPSELNKALETLSKYMPAQIDEAKVKAIVKDEVSKLPQSTPIKVDVTTFDGEIKRIDGAHKEMARLLYLLAKKHHVYLYGPPGSGKSTAAKMAADALNIPFGYISLNPQTPDSRLMGYMDANGNYRETLFFQLYRDGGIFCIDEMDNSSASLLTTLNSCLENGYGSFPCGMIKRHDNFIVVATGNTVGRGANPQFPDRRPFDSAFSERFTYLEWDYDLALEEAITLAINSDAKTWLKWVRNVREYAKKNHPKLTVSPRASFKGAEYLKDSKWSSEQIADAILFKGIDVDTRKAILQAHPIPASK